MRILFSLLRVGVALAILAAIVGQLMTSLAYWHAQGVESIGVSITNFFSFFTVESNVASILVLGVGAYLLAAGRIPDPRWFLVTRAAVVTYMVTTGIVYNLLLRGIELPQGSTLGWSNEVLHVIAPLYLLLDWLFAPGRAALTSKTIPIILVYPLAWVVYTLVRAPLTPDEIQGTGYWYPYPFLNPMLSPQGYFSVAFYVILIASVIGLVAAGVIWVSGRARAGLAPSREPAIRQDAP